MSVFVYDGGYLSVAGQDLSDHVHSMELTVGYKDLDDTSMGDEGEVHMGGLQSWKLDVELAQDYGTDSVDTHIYGALNVETALIVKPDGGATATTNPKWTGNGIILDYPVMSGKVGDQALVKVTFLPRGKLTRATAD
jgi:hypothetical protein